MVQKRSFWTCFSTTCLPKDETNSSERSARTKWMTWMGTPFMINLQVVHQHLKDETTTNQLQQKLTWSVQCFIPGLCRVLGEPALQSRSPDCRCWISCTKRSVSSLFFLDGSYCRTAAILFGLHSDELLTHQSSWNETASLTWGSWSYRQQVRSLLLQNPASKHLSYCFKALKVNN